MKELSKQDNSGKKMYRKSTSIVEGFRIDFGLTCLPIFILDLKTFSDVVVESRNVKEKFMNI
ncbi:hypothetical protein BpHYR1_002902 [Brachionus plicatilis]|uniref:Uncharacterized protein n=1 Tax=Brachionus plicatilis TaxID=10195 RepID=A0A3M7QBE2_BRAPC|nr:hypothetical protein BpHYR1_002902 [Brachionus plicatilis]